MLLPGHVPLQAGLSWLKHGSGTELGENTSIGETGYTARYASALYDLAFEQNVLGLVVEQMAALGRLISESDELRQFIKNPLTDPKLSGPLLNEALTKQGFSPLVRNFVNVAVLNRRLRDLPALVAGFAAYVAARRGEIVAYVTSAHGITDIQRAQLLARLTESGFGRVKLIESTDASLLGGLILKIGAKLYDTSLKSRLNRLNHSLKGAA